MCSDIQANLNSDDVLSQRYGRIISSILARNAILIGANKLTGIPEVNANIMDLAEKFAAYYLFGLLPNQVIYKFISSEYTLVTSFVTRDGLNEITNSHFNSP
jgi:hypothetical protein